MKKNRRNIINQVLWCILSALLGAIIGFYVDFFSSVNPNIEYIKNDLQTISEHSASIDESINEIKDMYLKRDAEGCICNVGVSSELEGNYVSVYKGNKLNLKSGDIIFITNPYGKFTPTIKFVVYLMEENPGDASTADLFVSREGIGMLDISPREVKKKGVFGMTMLRSLKDRNEKKK